jgi:hypothetical protein
MVACSTKFYANRGYNTRFPPGAPQVMIEPNFIQWSPAPLLPHADWPVDFAARSIEEPPAQCESTCYFESFMVVPACLAPRWWANVLQPSSYTYSTSSSLLLFHTQQAFDDATQCVGQTPPLGVL